MKKILLLILIVLVAIQFVPVNRTNTPIDKNQNFVDIHKPPQEVETIIKMLVTTAIPMKPNILLMRMLLLFLGR